MTVFLTGAAGQLGRELLPMLSSMGEVIPVDLNAVSDLPGLVQADLGEAGALHALLDQHRPRLIVNAAAYTAVDRAEQDNATAELINALSLIHI